MRWYHVQKDTLVGGLEIPAKILLQNSNERIIDEMKLLAGKMNNQKTSC